MNSFFTRFLRLVYHTQEELLLIVKDPAIILIFIIANIAYPLLYSVAYSNEQVKDVEIALLDLDKTATSRQMGRMLDATEGLYTKISTETFEEAKYLFYNGLVKGIILIDKDFEKNIFRGNQANLSIYADASYFLVYKQVYASAITAGQTFAAGTQLKKNLTKVPVYKSAINTLNPVNVKTVELFNPASAYGSFVMPSVILIILQQTLLIGIGILGGTRKEISRYNMMTVVGKTRKKIIPFLLGKSLAYFITYMVMGIFTLIWLYHWFKYPCKSTYFELFALYIPYLVANIFMGLALSVFFKHRENAMLFMVFLSIPVLFLSGATWPVEAIPGFIRKLSMIFPSTFMVPAFQRIRTMGADLVNVKSEIYAMLVQIVVYFAMAYFSFRYFVHFLSGHEKAKV